ncbi:MAG TPA: TetR/AcrR family transcriptional regulator [Nocardioidaceae bacterium]|nr:TetR/AcrR family transcriptional regulator [Nocardioidaceae bacterium]
MPGPRRTQAERRAETTDRVLAATIDCLVEQGYANTSTRHIARRAGLTVGAVQHHFPSKADLMAAALRALGDQMADEFLADAPTQDAPGDRVAQLLDRLWEVHRGPLFAAGLELWVAARSDAELRVAMEEVTRVFAVRIADGMLQIFPEQVAQPGFAETVMIGLAALRGLAIPGFVEVVEPEVLWEIARPQLLDWFEAALAGRPA